MSTTFLLNDILNLEKQLRTNLINSLPGIRQANLIGTINSVEQTNLAIFNSVMHIGANPPYMGFICRPTTVNRDTYNFIKETGYFTINQVNSNIVKSAHQTSARYTTSEFNQTDLTPYFSNNIKAPYVKESLVKIGLSFADEQLIKLNNTHLIIGKIEEIILENTCLNDEFIIQLNQTNAIGVNGLETYYSLTKEIQLPYAKP